jgi:peptidoglycan/xylan/chitin deacetylase (PgdA/CDA1 family)
LPRTVVAELCHESQGLPQDYNCCIALAQVTEPTARFRPEIAFTFDDPKIDSAAGLSCQETNRRILEVLDKRKVKAVLFVCGKRVDNVDGQRLIASWERAGHDIGNHSYSHRNFNFSGNDNSGPSGVTLSEFEAGTLKNEDLIRGYSHFVRLFRFPFFKEGDTLEKRDGMRSFLRQHDYYRIGRAIVVGISRNVAQFGLRRNRKLSSIIEALIEECSRPMQFVDGNKRVPVVTAPHPPVQV